MGAWLGEVGEEQERPGNSQDGSAQDTVPLRLDLGRSWEKRDKARQLG